MCQGDGSLDTHFPLLADLSIWRKPARPAPSRSKAARSAAAHSFQTGRCDVRVFPVSDKPDRFYYYDNVCPILPERKKDRLPAVMVAR